eukprot:scaffold8130_cov69-Phaeocystis_antarctica.AAC.5
MRLAVVAMRLVRCCHLSHVLERLSLMTHLTSPHLRRMTSPWTTSLSSSSSESRRRGSRFSRTPPTERKPSSESSATKPSAESIPSSGCRHTSGRRCLGCPRPVACRPVQPQPLCPGLASRRGRSSRAKRPRELAAEANLEKAVAAKVGRPPPRRYIAVPPSAVH